MDKFLYDIWLTSSVMGNPDYVTIALEQYKDAESVYENRWKLPQKISEKLDTFSLNDAKEVIRQCIANDIEIIDRESEFYPEYLQNTDIAPHIYMCLEIKSFLEDLLFL